MGCHFLLQGIFLTQGSNPRCRQMLYCLSYREVLSARANDPEEDFHRRVCVCLSVL